MAALLYDRAVLRVDETPDDTRPRNVWPRLLAFGALALLGLAIAGACLALYVNSVPDRDLRISAAALEPGLPRLLPVTTWGADAGGRTYGAWVVLLEDGSGPRAFLSLDPHSTCHVRWDGAFVDPCEGSRYEVTGALADGPATRGLDWFDVRIVDGELIVDIERVTLGTCADAAAGAEECSTEAETRTRSVPAGPLRGLEGYR